MTDPAEGALEAIAERFRSSFATTPPRSRTVGREAELTIVTPDGRAASSALLWPLLLETPGARPLFDQPGPDGSRLPIGAETDRWFAVAEVGRGTVEIGVGPRASLFELADDLREACDLLIEAAGRAGLVPLAYGIQPRTPPSPALMTPKRRYLAFLDVVGRSWLRFGMTASDQLQCALGRDELVEAMNAVNAVSGALVAVSANSSVYGGRPGAFASGREGLMRDLVHEPHRHGSVPRAFADELDYVRWAAGFRCLVLPDGPAFRTPGVPYRELAAREGPRFEDFSYHEHYLWPSARPRSRLGTLEIRPACQQPSMSFAACALSLGVVEARRDVLAYVEDALGESAWMRLLAYRDAAVRRGLAAPEPVEGFVSSLVDLADAGLHARGLGEERLLAPVRERLELGRGPADEVRDALVAGGIEAVVARTRFEGFA